VNLKDEKGKPESKEREAAGEYDIKRDWEAVEASFAMYYGIRLPFEEEMSWREFAALLKNLGAETPLGVLAAARRGAENPNTDAQSALERLFG
jgi:hypothetical protein